MPEVQEMVERSTRLEEKYRVSATESPTRLPARASIQSQQNDSERRAAMVARDLKWALEELVQQGSVQECASRPGAWVPLRAVPACSRVRIPVGLWLVDDLAQFW